jgi:hypothetical protein
MLHEAPQEVAFVNRPPQKRGETLRYVLPDANSLVPNGS